MFTGEKEVEEDRSKMLVINLGKSLVSVHRLSKGTLIIVYSTNKDPSLCASAVNNGISMLEKSKKKKKSKQALTLPLFISFL